MRRLDSRGHTKEAERTEMWVRVQVQCGWVLTNCPPWLPPTGPRRLVSSRRHRPLPTFPLPFPVDSSLPTDPAPQKTQSLREQPRILPIGCPLAVCSSFCRRFHRAAGNTAATEPFISPPSVTSRLSEGLLVTRVQGCLAFRIAELTRDLGPGTIRRRPQPSCWESVIPPSSTHGRTASEKPDTPTS